jgi:membrane protease YdiL (CAAX protease family)
MTDAFDFKDGAGLAAGTIAAFMATERFAIACHVDPSNARLISRAVMLVILAFAARGAWRARFAIRRPRAIYIVVAILFGFGSGTVLAWLNHPIVAWLGPDRAAQREVAAEGLAFGLFVHALYGPICEELVFRGVLVRSLATRWRWPATIAVSSLAFALYHTSPFQIVETVCFGAVAAYLVLRSGSLIPGLVMHVTTNVWIHLGWYEQPGALWAYIAGHRDQYSVACALATFTSLWLLWKDRE